jgi:hypothetical protein
LRELIERHAGEQRRRDAQRPNPTLEPSTVAPSVYDGSTQFLAPGRRRVLMLPVRAR